MNIAHILSSFHIGGGERVALDLARHQVQQGCRVLAVSLGPPPDGPLAQEFRRIGAQIRTLPNRGRGLDVGLVVRLTQRLRSEGIEVVHTHNPLALIYGGPAARFAGAVAVHTKHGGNPTTNRRLWLRRIAGLFADRYVAVAPLVARSAVESVDCAQEKLCVVKNGIDVELFRPHPAARREVRAELGIPEGALVVGTVGRLSPEKNQRLLIDAMAPLLDPMRRLVLIGDGPERGALEGHVSSRLGPRARFVTFTGARADTHRLYPALDVFALTSHREGLPLVIPEAMACELPVVATAVGGIPDVIEHELSGLLVPSGDELGLSLALQRLLEDRSFAQAIAGRVRKLAVDRYSVERMARDYFALYENALRRRGRRATIRSGGAPDRAMASGTAA